MNGQPEDVLRGIQVLSVCALVGLSLGAIVAGIGATMTQVWRLYADDKVLTAEKRRG